MDNIIKKGQKAIDFSLKDQEGKEVALKDFEGKQVLLSFHPLAWTAGWLDHIRSLEVNYDRFIDKNTIPLGINVDHEHSKAAWAKVINLSKLTILSDYNPLGKTAKDYGVFLEDLNASGRANILIDKDGLIKWVKAYEIDEIPDFEEEISNL